MEVLSGSCAIKIEPITMRSPVEHVYGNDDECSDSFYDDVDNSIMSMVYDEATVKKSVSKPRF